MFFLKGLDAQPPEPPQENILCPRAKTGPKARTHPKARTRRRTKNAPEAKDAPQAKDVPEAKDAPSDGAGYADPSMLFFVIVLIMVPYFQSTLGNASTVTPSPVTAHAPASVA